MDKSGGNKMQTRRPKWVPFGCEKSPQKKTHSELPENTPPRRRTKVPKKRTPPPPPPPILQYLSIYKTVFTGFTGMINHAATSSLLPYPTPPPPVTVQVKHSENKLNSLNMLINTIYIIRDNQSSVYSRWKLRRSWTYCVISINCDKKA